MQERKERYYTRPIETDSEKQHFILMPNDKYCQLLDETIVWKRDDILHNCPYQRIGEDQLNLIGKNTDKHY